MFFPWTSFRRVLVLALILGQILSLLLCAGGLACAALEKLQGISAPTTQLFLSYFLLAFVFGIVLACKEGFLTNLWRQWWKYMILGLIDAEANYLVVLAYKYTSFTSIQVIFAALFVLYLSSLSLSLSFSLSLSPPPSPSPPPPLTLTLMRLLSYQFHFLVRDSAVGNPQ